MCNVSYEATNIDKLLLGWCRELLPGAQHPFIFFRTSLTTSWVFPILAKLVPIPCPIFTVRFFLSGKFRRSTAFPLSSARIELNKVASFIYVSLISDTQNNNTSDSPTAPQADTTRWLFFLFIFTRCLPKGCSSAGGELEGSNFRKNRRQATSAQNH